MVSVLRKIHELDTSAFLWLHVTKKVPYKRWVRGISRTGDGPTYVVLAALLTLGGVIDPASDFFAIAGLAYAIEISLYLLLKNSVRRARPEARLNNYQAFITPSDTFSFPSGHTAAAFVFAWLLAPLMPALAGLLFAWAAAIGASRVLLGVHFPSDIAAGAVLGSSAVLLATLILGS